MSSINFSLESFRYLFIFLSVYYIFLPFSKVLFNYFFAVHAFSKRKLLRKSGSWAVVTGATDGIGRAYAEELAADGFSIVLISRTPEKLADVACAIEKKYQVKTKTVAVDFTKADIYNAIRAELEGLDIGVLVNNVGMSFSYPNYFCEDYDEGFFTSLINCNMVSVVMMTRLILPGMIARGKGGAVINVASASGDRPVPLLTLYSASKAFVDYFARAVNLEVAKHGIFIQSVLPFFVATKMSKIRKASFMIPSPADYAKSALNMVGVESRTYGCFSHSLIAFVLSLIPNFIRDSSTFKTMAATRKRALKKMEKTQ